MNSTWQSLRGRLGMMHPGHKRIAVAAIWVALFVLVAKLAAAAREVAIAYQFGVTGVVDAYQLAVTLSSWGPVALVSVFSVVGVPLFVRLRKLPVHDVQQFLRELLGVTLVIGCILSLLTIVAGFLVLPLLGAGLSEATLTAARSLTIGLAVLAPLILVAGIYATQLMARETHTNTLLEGIPPAFIAIVLLIWPSPASFETLLWGTVLGYAVQVLWLRQVASSRADRLRWPVVAFRSPYWRDMYRAIGVMATGQLVMSLVVFVDQYTAASLGDSAIATLGYANRVLTLFLGIGAMAVARAALPVLSEIRSEDHGLSKRMAVRWAGLMFLLGALGAILAWILAPSGMQLLYERGAFNADDTAEVARVFRFGLLQVPFYFCGLVLVQLLASAGYYRAIALVAIGNFAVKVVTNAWLAEHFGVAGIALSSGVMYVFAMCAFLLLALRLHR